MGDTVGIFVGSHEQRIDRKGRVSVPARFRDVLGKSATFYAFPALSNSSIECHTSAFMEDLSQDIDSLDPFSDEQDHLSAAIFGMSFPLTPDKDGRVILPDALRDHSGIAEAVVYVGKGRSFQIWEPVRFQTYQKQVRDRALADRRALRRRPQGPAGNTDPVESGT